VARQGAIHGQSCLRSVQRPLDDHHIEGFVVCWNDNAAIFGKTPVNGIIFRQG